jgi:hypothetical protein
MQVGRAARSLAIEHRDRSDSKTVMPAIVNAHSSGMGSTELGQWNYSRQLIDHLYRHACRCRDGHFNRWTESIALPVQLDQKLGIIGGAATSRAGLGTPEKARTPISRTTPAGGALGTGTWPTPETRRAVRAEAAKGIQVFRSGLTPGTCSEALNKLGEEIHHAAIDEAIVHDIRVNTCASEDQIRARRRHRIIHGPSEIDDEWVAVMKGGMPGSTTLSWPRSKCHEDRSSASVSAL